ncbi:MAG TPA: hypothetical protein VGC97_14300 [Pyrinomonadaceae bacterium]|jgi:hypothetical protein
MKKRFQLFATVVILLLMANFAFSQTRITFKRGARFAIVTGNLNGYRSRKTFVIRVRRGQVLRTAQAKSGASRHDITVYIKAPNGEEVGDSDASCNNRREISPTRAGDYRIEVVECRKADAWRGKFKLKITVR